MVENKVDLFLLNLIKDNNNIVYKITASDLYKSFKIYCSDNDIKIISNKIFGVIIKTYKSIFYYRHVKRYYNIIIPNLKQDLIFYN